jgi:hypothetical protein
VSCGKPIYPRYLDPFREFVLDPTLKLWIIMLPPFAHYVRADGFIATFLSYTSVGSLHIFLRSCGAMVGPTNPRTTARRMLLRRPTTTARFQPPSDSASSRTAISRLCLFGQCGPRGSTPQFTEDAELDGCDCKLPSLPACIWCGSTIGGCHDPSIVSRTIVGIILKCSMTFRNCKLRIVSPV